MPVKRTIPYSFGTFFITFTSYNWLPLIDKVDGYEIVYKWFDYLKQEDHFVNAFVIMPNHVHAIISFVDTAQSINIIVGNGKRFMAYDIIKRLYKNNEHELLKQLSEAVEAKRKTNNKKHEIWELSFDWKECISDKFIQQKLDYIHLNPCKGKWNLCATSEDYKHSSAKFYLTGEDGFYKINNVAEIKDKVFFCREVNGSIDATSGKYRDSVLISKRFLFNFTL